MIKLTLDHSALMALFESEGEEFKLSIRETVLKTAAENAGMLAGKGVVDELSRIAVKAAQKEIGNFSGAYSVAELALTPPFAKALNNTIDNLVTKTLQTKVMEMIDYEKIDTYIENMANSKLKNLEANINSTILKHMNSRIERHINDEIEARLKLLTQKTTENPEG